MKELMARLEAEMEAEIITNNENFEVIQSTPVSRMDTHRAWSLTVQAEVEAKMNIHQEMMEAAVHSIHPVRGNNETSVGRHPVVCRPKDGGPAQGTDRDDW
jgi:phosphate starvation-inducible protein PhoH